MPGFGRSSGPGAAVTVCLLAVLTLACLLPFAGKAFHVDDPLFVWVGQQIERRPLDFYGFEVNWYGTRGPMHEVTKNPPLAAYLLAAGAAVGGWREPVLHGVFLLPALGVVLGTFALARRLCRRPLVAGLLVVASPAFLVAGTSVMSDMPMVCLYVLAVWLWIEGLERDAGRWLVAAGTLAALAVLTKYFALSLVPLLAVYAVARKRRAGAWVLALSIPVLVLVGYELLARQLYGVGLVTDAARYATAHRPQEDLVLPARALVALAFTGGCFLPLLFVAPLAVARRRLAAGAAVAIGLAATLLALKPSGFRGLVVQGQIDPWLACHIAVFAAIGLGLLSLALAEPLRRKDAESLLLVLWIVGTFVFAGFVNWTINGRSLLPMIPAASILLARHVERRSRTVLLAALVPAVLIGLLAAWGDSATANAQRRAAARIVETHPPGRRSLWFQGHWGFQYYMQRAGARALDYARTDLEPGAILVIPSNNTNTRRLPDGAARGLETLELPIRPWATTLQPESGAGFHSHVWGPVPFRLGPVPPERFSIVEIVRPLRAGRQQSQALRFQNDFN